MSFRHNPIDWIRVIVNNVVAVGGIVVAVVGVDVAVVCDVVAVIGVAVAVEIRLQLLDPNNCLPVLHCYTTCIQFISFF
jgi:hypothetical protein